jgi:hypothetical protein
MPKKCRVHDSNCRSVTSAPVYRSHTLANVQPRPKGVNRPRGDRQPKYGLAMFIPQSSVRHVPSNLCWVREATQGLAGANLTVLNGATGLSEVATGLVGQGLAIFDSLRELFRPSSVGDIM